MVWTEKEKRAAGSSLAVLSEDGGVLQHIFHLLFSISHFDIYREVYFV